MRFRIVVHIDAPADSVVATLVDTDFIAATASLPPLGEAKVLACERDDDRVVMQVRYRFTGKLPRAAKAVVDPDRLTWIDHAIHDLASHRSDHRIAPDHYPDRLQAHYSTEVSSEPGGSRRTAAGSVRVRAPMVASRVERAIVSGLEEHARAEAELLTRWLADDLSPPAGR